MGALRPLAIVKDYDGLHQACRAYVDKISVSRVVIDEVAGLPSGYAGKVLGPNQAKRLGMTSLGPFLQTVGLVLIVAQDTDASARMLERIGKNYDPRQANQVRLNNHSHLSQKIIDDVLGHLTNNKKGGLTVLNNAVKEARSNWARRAGKASWGKKRDQRQICQIGAGIA
jgi:hypothetical protein